MPVKNSKYTPYRKMIVNYEIPSHKIAQIIGNCTASAVRAARRRFLKPVECKKTNAKWRKNNRAYENSMSRISRKKTRKTAANHKTTWTIAEEKLILESHLTTRELAKELGRTMDAIYKHRHRLKKKLRKGGL